MKIRIGFVLLLCCRIKTHNKINTYKVMKSTLKISALILAFAGFTLGAKAQTTTPAPTSTTTTSGGVRLSIGVDAGIPTGKLNDAYNWNLGGSIQADIPVNNYV